MVDLLLDLAFREKSMFQDNFQTELDLSNITELIKRTAYDDAGVGMPVAGLGNVLTNQNFLKFQEKIVPENTIISLSNIKNPDEAIASILTKIKERYPKYLRRAKVQTTKSVYKGGLKSFNSDGEFFEFAAAFPGAPFKS